ncbi:hypothetical protein MPSI1_002705 [Malassezia psittaci]|uniref:Uncharacterized protein n=1 Tax=Malassezia psittaci TaxID=1821823 RepID=A0AAF0JEY4_9BASI|nr:hypothetical protein MPSI1_002705 [Malassezia psittaci]
MSLTPAFKALLKAPKYAARTSKHSSGKIIPAGSSGEPLQPPRTALLQDLFKRVSSSAERHHIGWGEWMTVMTATMFALNSPGSLQAMHRYVMSKEGSQELRPVAERVNRACLMREVGLKCIGLIGTPKSINNLAALRAMVDADSECAKEMPSEPRREINANEWDHVCDVGATLYKDIYQEKAERLRQVLSHSHPDLSVYILQNEYGPLFAPPPSYKGTDEPIWEVNRVRVSLMNMAALHAQGGVAPQVTSHTFGLLRSKPSFQHVEGPQRQGLDFLSSIQGAEWVIHTVNDIASVLEGTEDEDRQTPSPPSRL